VNTSSEENAHTAQGKSKISGQNIVYGILIKQYSKNLNKRTYVTGLDPGSNEGVL